MIKNINLLVCFFLEFCHVYAHNHVYATQTYVCIFKYLFILFIWLQWILVVANGLFVAAWVI